MRKFHSYGPVNEKNHFTVPRKELVQACYENLVGDPEQKGHYFTIWAPRQAGKTWIMRQVADNIRRQYPEQFTVFCFSFGVLRGIEFQGITDSGELPEVFAGLLHEMLPGNPIVKTWRDFRKIFSKTDGLWDRPLILCIDEVDTISPEFLDIIAGQFREMYLDRENNLLHGLALIGVRAVLGIESERGSPFNIQKSLHVPNLTPGEVEELFHQYQEESGQKVQPGVVESLYENTRGQPGLVSWFGELLTENEREKGSPITIEFFNRILNIATNALPNVNVMNIIAKADKAPYRSVVLDLFKTDKKTEFAFDDRYLNYLYMNGVIDTEEENNELYVRFSSPFIQKRLFNFFSRELFGYLGKIVDPFEDIGDIITKDNINIVNLIKRYEIYLRDNRKWLLEDAPRRKDLRIFEAVFHFNLFMYLNDFLKIYKSKVFPEFPTGNGKIDLFIKHGRKIYGIELKTWTNAAAFPDILSQTARYGKQLGLQEIFLVLFVESVDDENREKYEAVHKDKKNNTKVIPVFVETGI